MTCKCFLETEQEAFATPLVQAGLRISAVSHVHSGKQSTRSRTEKRCPSRNTLKSKTVKVMHLWQAAEHGPAESAHSLVAKDHRDLSVVACVSHSSCVFPAQDLQAALNAVGVAQISCNPITDNNAAKALQRVAAAEAMPLTKEQALSIARNASGDLRSALDMLQLLCTGVQPVPPQPKTRKVSSVIQPPCSL